MKKYKLKERHQKHINKLCGLNLKFGILPLTDWEQIGYNIEALEEVEDRVELSFCTVYNEDAVGLFIPNGRDLTWDDLKICEKALNGELFTKDDLYQFAQNCLNKCEGEYFSPDLLDTIFKEIKEKK